MCNTCMAPPARDSGRRLLRHALQNHSHRPVQAIVAPKQHHGTLRAGDKYLFTIQGVLGRDVGAEHSDQHRTIRLKLVSGYALRILIAALQGLAGTGDQASADQQQRSEEHTSELQSLMRISYAVFCLKKKKNRSTTHK